jgi:biotin carboxylase
MAERPVLAVAFGPRSVPLFTLREAARPVADLLWVIDSAGGVDAAGTRLLRKVGPVVDIAGRPAAAVAEELRPYGPAGLITFFDTGMVRLAEIAETLDLPFHRPAVAALLVDKELQREALRAGRLDVPRCWAVPADRDVTALSRTARFPAVIKPRTGSGSWHTFRIADAAELVAVCAPSGPLDPGDDMVLEEYIPDGWPGARPQFADYVSVESIVEGGRIIHVAVTGRFTMAETFRETGFFVPSDLGAGDEAAVLDLAGRALRALGVEVGCVHTEIKLTADGPRVIEVNGRLGGGIPDLVAIAAGVPLLEVALRVAVGEPAGLTGPVACDRVAYRFLVQPPVGARRVLGIAGLDRLAAMPGVADVSVHHPPGDAIDWREGSRSFVFTATGSVAGYEELRAMDVVVREQVDLEFER